VPNEKKTSGTTRSLLFSQDGLRLAGITSTRENVFVRVWDLDLNPASRLVLNLTRKRASSERLPRLLAITPDNTYLAMGSIPGQQIEIIDLKSKTTVLSFNEKVTSLSIRPSPLPPLNQLAWVTSDGLLKIISIPSRAIQRDYITLIQNRPLIEYSRGGRYLAVAGTCTDELNAKRGARGNEKEFISLYDLNSDQESPLIVNDKRLKATDKPLNCMDLSLSSAVNTITFLAKDIDISNSTYTNMPILATTRRDGTIRLWSFAKQHPGDTKLLVLTDLINAGRRDNTNSPNIRVSPNGDFYIATNVRNMISIRSPLSASPDFLAKGPPFFYDLTPEQSGVKPVNAIGFSDDSKHMALTYANPSKSVSIFSLPIDRGSKPDNVDVQYGKLPLAGWMYDQKNRTIKPGKYSTYTKSCDLNGIEEKLRYFGLREDNPNRLLFFNKNARLCMLGPFLVNNKKSVSESAISKFSTDQELKIFSPNDKNFNLQLSLPDIMDGPIQSFNDSAISQDGKMLMTANDDGTVGIWNISPSQSNNRKDASDSRNFLSINLKNIPLFALVATLFQSNHQKIPTAAREFLPISLDNKPLVALATANVNPKHGGDQCFAIAYENNNIRIFKLFDGLRKSACDKLAQSYKSGQTDQSPDSFRLARRWQQLNDEKICNSSLDTGPMDSFRKFISRRISVFLK
jgi:WD40 repeat protein